MSPDKNKIEFITAMIGAFAHQSQLTRQQAYRYIQRFQGIEFLEKHYEIIHTLDFNEALSYLTRYCYKKGGSII